MEEYEYKSTEIIMSPEGRRFKAALFDFDGTLSLIREGWQEIMIPYFCEELTKVKAENESNGAITACVTEFVDSLTGKQTIFQCEALCDEIAKRGGTPESAMFYKDEYLKRLMQHISARREGLKNGTIEKDELLVSGAARFLQTLKDAGIDIYCASGTDQPQVREEAELLGLGELFGGHIYGALDEHARECSKEVVMKRLLSEHNVKSDELLSFGDGFVEIELVSKEGGYSVAVATDEKRRKGVDEKKRQRLISAGAGAVIPDFAAVDEIMQLIVRH